MSGAAAVEAVDSLVLTRAERFDPLITDKVFPFPSFVHFTNPKS